MRVIEKLEPVKCVELYNTNPKLKEYVDKYMRNHGLTDLESTMECMVVQNYIHDVIGGNR